MWSFFSTKVKENPASRSGSKFLKSQVITECTIFRYDKNIKRPYEKIRLGRIEAILFKILCV